MSAGIVLTAADIDTLRNNVEVDVVDGRGRLVTLYPWASTRERTAGVYANLSVADLTLIEKEPEGLRVADSTRSTGWLIRHAGA